MLRKVYGKTIRRVKKKSLLNRLLMMGNNMMESLRLDARTRGKVLVSVVTPARNAAGTIRRCIDSVLSQEIEGDFEHIVVEDGSTDETEAILKRYSELRARTFRGMFHYYKGPGTGPAAARNVGIKHARGDIIVFIDADCTAEKGWLRNLIRHFRDESVGGVCGSVKTPEGLSTVGKVIGLDWEYRQEDKIIKSKRWFHAMNTAYRKELFKKVGLLDEELVTGEDMDLTSRAFKTRYNFIFDKEAVVYHYHRSTLKQYLKQFFDYGKGSYRLFRKKRDIEQLLIPMYFLMLTITLFLIPISVIFAYLALILFALGFGKYFFNSIQVLYRSRDKLSLFIGPLAYAGRFARFLGFFSAAVTGRENS